MADFNWDNLFELCCDLEEELLRADLSAETRGTYKNAVKMYKAFFKADDDVRKRFEAYRKERDRE